LSFAQSEVESVIGHHTIEESMSASPKNPAKSIAAVAGSDNAPVIFADAAYAWGTNRGIVQLELGINTLVPIEGADKVRVRPVATAHLRLSPLAAAQMRDMLTKVLDQFEAEAEAMGMRTDKPATPAAARTN
jgi:membrane peptidoglycan carboxypeptidase